MELIRNIGTAADALWKLFIFLVFVLLMLGSVCGEILKHANLRNNFWDLGGKIGRKFFILNSVVIVLLIIILSALSIVVKISGFKFVIAILMLCLLFLSWNNVHKRVYSISDKLIPSFVFSMIFGLFTLTWFLLKDKGIIHANFIYLCVDVMRIILWLLLFSIPSAKVENHLKDNL